MRPPRLRYRRVGVGADVDARLEERRDNGRTCRSTATEARTVALVVDDLGLSFASTYEIRKAVRKFVDSQILPEDLVAIVRTAGGVGALQQLTTDKRVLHAAIDNIRWTATSRFGIGPFTPVNDSKWPSRPGPMAMVPRTV